VVTRDRSASTRQGGSGFLASAAVSIIGRVDRDVASLQGAAGASVEQVRAHEETRANSDVKVGVMIVPSSRVRS
jgi:hypothetical protein